MTMMQRPWSRKWLKTNRNNRKGLMRLKVKHAKVEQQALTSESPGHGDMGFCVLATALRRAGLDLHW